MSVYPLTIGTDEQQSRTEAGFSIGRSDGNVGSSVGSSIDHGYGKLEGYTLRYALGPGYRTDGGASDGISYSEVYWRLEICYLGGLLDVRVNGKLGEIPLVGLLGAHIESEKRLHCWYREMLVVGLEQVHYVSDVVFRYVKKVPVWVRRSVEIVIRSNHEILPVFVESLCGDVGRQIIGKWEVNWKVAFQHLLCLQEFVLVVTPQSRMLWYNVRTKTNRFGLSRTESRMSL